MSDPLAYFLTWTCYGTWLHGDKRGSVDRLHNTLDSPLLPPQPARRQAAAARMVAEPIELTPDRRSAVERAIRDHCAHRGWSLLALNVRTNHVHVVLACPPDVRPEQVLVQFKAWATRRLREARLVPPDAPVWSHHGSTRWINDRAGVETAVTYVTDGQGAERFERER